MPTTDGYWHNLTRSQALALRESYRNGATMTRLSREYGISRSTVSQLVHGAIRPVLGLPAIPCRLGRPRKRFDT